MADNNLPLKNLYPFLHGEKQSPDDLNAALLESVAQKAAHSVAVKQSYFEHNAQAVVDTAKAIAEVYNGGGKMLSMGNGGSSCDAAHFAVEFQHPITTGRPALPVINLIMDTAMLSAHPRGVCDGAC